VGKRSGRVFSSVSMNFSAIFGTGCRGSGLSNDVHGLFLRSGRIPAQLAVDHVLFASKAPKTYSRAPLRRG
jgi:hypothetical protein